MDVRADLPAALVSRLSRAADVRDPHLRAWTWVLVAPCEQAPEGFLNVQTGEAHAVVW